MEALNNCRQLPARTPSRPGPDLRSPVEKQIQRIKQNVYQNHRSLNNGEDRLLQLALNEAEGLAWQTGFPHLFFPVLAAEKAQAAVAWNLQQQKLRRSSAEIALAV